MSIRFRSRTRTVVTLSLISITTAAIAFASISTRRQSATSTAASTVSSGARNDAIIPDCVSNPVVINSNDSGAGSLRDAILNACVGGTITFNIPANDPSVGVIGLASPLTISSSLSISGPGVNVLKITGPTRLFVINGSGVVTISGLSIWEGAAGNSNGGAILIGGTGTINIVNTEFTNNTAGGDGGAIYNSSSATINIIDSTFQTNNAYRGGAIFLYAGRLNITNSIFLHNGGTVISNSGTTIVSNSTFDNDGEAILNYGGATAVATNVTITTDSTYPALTVLGGTVKLRNCIMARLSTAQYDLYHQADLSGAFISQGHNLIGGIDSKSTGFTVGKNNPNGDLVGTPDNPIHPQLQSLANNGGPTLTMALQPDSPALDAGDNCVSEAAHCGDASISQLITDQRGTGFNRSVDGNADGTPTVDIGAFESASFGTPAATAPTTTSVTSSANPSDFGQTVTVNAIVSSSTFVANLNGAQAGTNSTATGSSKWILSADKTTARVLLSYSAISGATHAVLTNGNPPPWAKLYCNPCDQVIDMTRWDPSYLPSAIYLLKNGKFYADVVRDSSSATEIRGYFHGPTGTLQFKDNGFNIGTPVALDATGTAQLVTSSLTAGTHVITADYLGDPNFLPSGGTLSGGQVVKAVPSLSIDDVGTYEGDVGTSTLNFTVTLSAASSLPVNVNFATTDGPAAAPSDYVATNGALTFNPGETSKTIPVIINGDQTFEPDETFRVNLSNAVNAVISKAQGSGTIANDDAQGGIISYSLSNYNASESAGFVTVTVNRTGDISNSATVDYATDDTGAPPSCATVNGRASSLCDFTTALGTLRFTAGESAKSFRVLVSEDYYREGPETLSISLSNMTGGAVLGVPSTANVTILDDGSGSAANPIDEPEEFAAQHYHDFLNHEADASGLGFWINEITSCGSDLQCIEVKRINVSASFFVSIEFQQTGYLVERIYKTSFGDAIVMSTLNGGHTLPVPVMRLNEFLRDTQQIGDGVIVLQPGWENQLESNKQAFTLAFVQGSGFTTAYSTSLTPAKFVDMLFANTGVTPAASDRNAAIGEFGTATNTSDIAARGRALRWVAENSTLTTNEFNRAFVLMQYFGYLRRDPSDSPDSDYTGYDFWLTKLNQFNGNYINAEMVKAFIGAGEYRQRFGP